MEMEDEKNAEANSADGDDLTEDENLSGDQYEITVGDIDPGELDFDIVDFDLVDNEEDEIEIPSWALGELTGLDDWSNAALAHSSWAEVSQCLMNARQFLISEKGMDGN